jgi:hypothetical protein
MVVSPLRGDVLIGGSAPKPPLKRISTCSKCNDFRSKNMSENAEKGKSFIVVIGTYMVLKEVLNLILSIVGGGGFAGIANVVIAGIILFALIGCPKWIKYIVALFLAVTFFRHILGNIKDIFGNLIYIIEGILDIICAIVLVINPAITAFYDEKSNPSGSA